MKLYGVWEISLPGETYRFEPDEVTPGEEIMILDEAGCDTYEEWIARFNRREAIACQTLIWFLRRKAGRQEERISVQITHRKIDATLIEPPPSDSPEASAASGSSTPEAATSSSSSIGSESDPGSGAS